MGSALGFELPFCSRAPACSSDIADEPKSRAHCLIRLPIGYSRSMHQELELATLEAWSMHGDPRFFGLLGAFQPDARRFVFREEVLDPQIGDMCVQRGTEARKDRDQSYLLPLNHKVQRYDHVILVDT